MNEVDKYISGFPAAVQERLIEIRNIILEIAPQVTERICMRMPTYDLNGKWLVHFAGFEKHIGFYPQPVRNQDMHTRKRSHFLSFMQ
ncbi:MAG: DUF1801 domain-containing protein [Tannerella sp.]|jgi:uncharacterized protein YdhG (YjbR/CyaY superfamily)|nr:DUF1801 domain-containing protein [Tannerella sp.]